MVGIFLPTMMHPSVSRSDSTWHRTLAIIKPDAPLEPLLARAQRVVSLAFERQRAIGSTNMSKQSIENYLHQTVVLESARSGVSDLQHPHRRALAALGVLVASVLLIGCGNVANLMTAQAAARAREMALRVPIGAAACDCCSSSWLRAQYWPWLQQCLAHSLHGVAPFIVSMINPPDNPARLFLPVEARVFAFGVVLTLAVTLLFGLTPALALRRSSRQVPSKEETIHTLGVTQCML